MTTSKHLDRAAALTELSSHGVKGREVYLLEVIPLVEMLWADGIPQPAEVELIEAFLRRHVEAVNELAGTEVLQYPAARAFLERYLQERPSPALLARLRDLVASVSLSSSEVALAESKRAEILEFCLDIGSACVADLPTTLRDRFDSAEKAALRDILSALRP